MSKHTPGPWHVSAVFPGPSHNFEPRVSVCGKYEGGDIRLADIPDVAGRDSEALANARLIAAAPDLLAALREILDETPRGFTETAEILMRARAAIAAAAAEVQS